MTTIYPIDLGITEDDNKGDKLRIGGDKINRSLSNLNSGKMEKSLNLLDIPNNEIARSNLSVYSIGEIDTRMNAINSRLDIVEGDDTTTGSIAKAEKDAKDYATQRSNHQGTQLSTTISDFNEASQDAVGNILTDTDTINLTYDDVNNQIKADIIDESINDSKIALNAGISPNKIGDGTVGVYQFSYISDLTQPVQQQIDARQMRDSNAIDGNIAIMNEDGTAYGSSKKFNDNGLATDDIWSASKVNDMIIQAMNQLPVGASSGITYYLTNTASGINDYDIMQKTPDTIGEVEESVIVNNNQSLIDTYISDLAIGKTSIEAGIWNFNLWGSVSSTANVSNFIVEVYTRSSGGTETLLFSAESVDINSTTYALVTIETVKSAFTVNQTDKLLIKIYGKTTRTLNTTIKLYHSGTLHYSHFHIPLVIEHNDLPGIQGGTSGDRQHLTSSQVDIINNVTTNLALKENVSNKRTTFQVTPDDNHYITEKLAKDTLDLKADDSNVVHKTGNETINGTKTFGVFPESPSSLPTTDYQLANKKYTDTKIDKISITDSWAGISSALVASQKALYDALNSTSNYSAIYVDPVLGNDTTGNGTKSQPWKTVNKALNPSGTPISSRTIYVNGSTTANITFSATNTSIMLYFDLKSEHTGNITLVDGNTSIYFLSPSGKATFSGVVYDGSKGTIYFEAIMVGAYLKTGGSGSASPIGYVEFSPLSNVDSLVVNLTGNSMVRTLGMGSMGVLTQTNGVFVAQHKGTMLCPQISGGSNPLLGQPILLLQGQIQLLKNGSNNGLTCSATYGIVYLAGISTLQNDYSTYSKIDFTGAGANCFCLLWGGSQLASSGDVPPPSGFILVNSANYFSASRNATNYTGTSTASVKAHLDGIDTALGNTVAKNTSITGATKTKITYDAKGLVTNGVDAGIADITGLQTALDNKQSLDTDLTQIAGLTQSGNKFKVIETDGTNYALNLPVKTYTTTQRNALTNVPDQFIIWNSTDSTLQQYSTTSSTWSNLASVSTAKKLVTPGVISQNGLIPLSNANSVIQVYDCVSVGLLNASINYNTRNQYTEQDATNGTDNDGTQFTLKSTLGYGPTAYTSTSLVPVMTSNTAPSGTVISSGNWVNDGNRYKVFNGADEASIWISGDAYRFIGYTFPSAKVINKFSWAPATSYFASTTYAPTKLNLIASNDGGANWVTIGTNTSITGWAGGTAKIFQHSNATPYTSWAVAIPLGGYGNVDNCYPGEIKFYEAGLVPTYPINTAYSITTTNSSQIALSALSLTSITDTYLAPTNTVIRRLISIDGRTTWLGWNGSAWASVTPSYANATDRATFANNIASLNVSSATTIDIMDFLFTTDLYSTPAVQNLQFNYNSSFFNYTCLTPGVDWTNDTLLNITGTSFTNNNINPSVKRLKTGSSQMAITYI